jgi:hypothetical protein
MMKKPVIPAVPIAETCPEVTLAQPDILTVEQVAHKLQVDPAFIFEKTRSRCSTPIPAIRIGRYLRFNWPSIVAWLGEQEGTHAGTRSYRRRRQATKGTKATT